MGSEQYKLRSVLSGHSMDVKCVSVVPEPPGSIITASRDKTARLWYPHEDMSYSVRKVFKGHPKYVSCVTYSGPSEEHPSGLIYTGCQDGKIRAYLPDLEEPFFQLDGHGENVTDIFVGTFGTIISGSWDKTAKVWVGRKCSMTLTGHEAAVWAVAILPEVGIMVSAGADRTVRLWKTGKLVNTLTGHTDAVRGIAVVSKEEFLTCSNDATVRRWSASGEQRGTYYGHQNYIYSISLMPNGRDWVTSGEDRTMRVWENNEIIQTIYLPAISVWSVCALQNGDIAASTSDGMVRVFSKDPSRQASQDLQELFKEEISKCSLAAQQELGGVKLSDLPGPEALYEPGKKDGQTKMVRTGDKVAVHSWDMSSQQWNKVGDVMGASGGSEAESGKKLYMGKEYDFVFDIEIDEPKATLKLPYNVTEDPWMVAQKFIHDNEMSQVYLDEIANHIVNNTKGQVLGVGAGGSADPLTGGAAYTPAGVSSGGGFTGGAAVDPFTGSGAYTSGSGGVSTGRANPPPDPWMQGAYRTEGAPDVNGGQSGMEVDEPNPYFPQTSYLNFDQMPKADPITNKLKEFNANVEADQQVEIQVLENLATLATKDNKDASLVAALFKVFSWPDNCVFPALDILRRAIVNPGTREMLLAAPYLDEIFSVCLKFVDKSKPVPCQMLSLRILANMFSVKEGEKLMRQYRNSVVTRVFEQLFPIVDDNKNIQIAAATLLLNYSVSIVKSFDEEDQVQVLSVLCINFLTFIQDWEARFRTLVAIGTILHNSDQGLEYAKTMDTKESVRGWKVLEGPQKVTDCAKFIMDLF